ncbi:MAG: hypothetical protein RAO94_06870 [Candidatus Stygibacter australis]|nr:hypothetical protein [Candidatus Stygibacter australis]MDP8322054.1 hypothetical protein [Candidatus Stygibacter australis]
MNLKNITLYALLGYSYFFIMRAIGTIFPAINYSETWMIVELSLNFISNLGITLFFLILLKEYIHDDEFSLMNSTVAAFLGSLSILLINALNGFSSLLSIPMDHSISGRYIVTMVTWVYGFIIVIFFMNFAYYLCKNKTLKLCKPVLWGLGGTIISFILRSINMLNNYYYTTNAVIFLDLRRHYLILPSIILILFSYLSLIYFIIRFYKSLSKKK